MTGEQPPFDEAREPHDLSPEEQEEVSRLLADAAGPVPTPPDVVARLDSALAALVAARDGTAGTAGTAGAEDAPEAPGATVTPIAVRRRRWPKLLLAAAAVVVGGYGVGAAVTGSLAGSGGDDGGGSADSATAGGGSSSGSASDENGDVPRASGTVVVRISSDRFDAGVARALGASDLAALPTPQKDATKQRNEADARRSLDGALADCAPPRVTGRERWFPIRYDGAPATLVVGPERRGEVRARVVDCDGTTVLRAGTVDLR